MLEIAKEFNQSINDVENMDSYILSVAIAKMKAKAERQRLEEERNKIKNKW